MVMMSVAPGSERAHDMRNCRSSEDALDACFYRRRVRETNEKSAIDNADKG
jgi:hypothetical protein